jgi:hypothetical protein
LCPGHARHARHPVALLIAHPSAAKWANADCGAGTWADAHCMPTEAAADTCCRIGSRFAKNQWGADFVSQEGFLLKKVDTCVEKDTATRTYIHAFGIPLPRTCEGVEIDLGRRLVTASASSPSSFALLAARGTQGPGKQIHRHMRVIQGSMAYSRLLSLLSPCLSRRSCLYPRERDAEFGLGDCAPPNRGLRGENGTLLCNAAACPDLQRNAKCCPTRSIPSFLLTRVHALGHALDGCRAPASQEIYIGAVVAPGTIFEHAPSLGRTASIERTGSTVSNTSASGLKRVPSVKRTPSLQRVSSTGSGAIQRAPSCAGSLPEGPLLDLKNLEVVGNFRELNAKERAVIVVRGSLSVILSLIPLSSCPVFSCRKSTTFVERVGGWACTPRC